MIRKPNIREHKAFMNLRNNSDFQVVKEYLNKELEELTLSGMSSTDERLTRWYQGGWQTIKSFLSYTEDTK